MAALSDIRALARIHADQDSSDFPTDAQYNIIINSAGRRVWSDIMRAGYPFDFGTVNITSTGVTKYPLGVTGIMSVTGVYYTQGGQRYELKRLNEGQRASLLSTNAVSNYSEYYDVHVSVTNGMVVELLPFSSGITYMIDYIPGFGGFVADTDIWNGPMGSEDLVALRAAIIGIRKEGSGRRDDANDKEAEYKDMLQIVTDMATWVDLRNPAKIRDVQSIHNRFAFDYPVAGFSGGEF